ncbi:S1 family peptidase [Pseudonocardia abyssalis]|uniref:Trypsin-like peptidase domain-containing protein n=1 Tax=Pseudonocardia abyssalis TaxID=2792008 RepID=A0ABS6UXP3_9PSEU|nr:trypsin-like peptidase domain-containing protein [Pseudonocardia abyssalis]MBW0136937.1 trypsin-like peptidase domain-containing protein [Pseudonocardia abyssalis]
MALSPNSVASLLIEPGIGAEPIASGTAFVVTADGRHYIITNRHNVTGRDSRNRPVSDTSRMPDTLHIWHYDGDGRRISWRKIIEPLYLSPGHPAWFEHPVHGAKVDVVALPVTWTEDVTFLPHDQQSYERTSVAVRVAADVSIIGFPYGLTGGGALGIWSRGTIATEPDIDFDDLPLLLVDSRTRSGQSGSPVIFTTGGKSVPTKDGGTMMGSGDETILVGVYSGRVNAESDLGFVWKASVIDEIIAGGRRPSGESLLP